MESTVSKFSLNFEPINRNNVFQLKQLNNMSLPVRYSESFYLLLSLGRRFGVYAYFQGVLVGAITWKYNINGDERSIYIMTINVLDNYKRYGIGSALLKHMIEIHKDVKELSFINLHVQESNQSALNFYKKNNFETVKFIESYYTALYPRGAYYLRLKTN